MVFVDGDRRYVDCTNGVCELLGYSRPEILTKTIEDVSFDFDEVAPLFTTYLHSGAQEGDYILRHKTGDPVYVKYRAWVFPDGCLAATWQPAESWEQRYVAALLELRQDRLQAKIALAMNAILERQSELTSSDGLETHRKLREALNNLRAL